MAWSPLKEKGGTKPLCGVLGKVSAEKPSKVALRGEATAPARPPAASASPVVWPRESGMSLELKTPRPRLLGPGSLWHLRVCENPLWQHLESEHLHGSTRAESGDALAALFQRHGGWFQQFAVEFKFGFGPQAAAGVPPGSSALSTSGRNPAGKRGPWFGFLGG